MCTIKTKTQVLIFCSHITITKNELSWLNWFFCCYEFKVQLEQSFWGKGMKMVGGSLVEPGKNERRKVESAVWVPGESRTERIVRESAIHCPGGAG